MHIFMSTKSKEEAQNFIKNCDFNLGRTALFHKDGNNYKKYVSGNSADVCLAQMELEPEPIIGDWCFLFTGQGAQRPHMTKSIYDNSPIFKKHLDQCFNVFAQISDKSISDIIFSDNDEINHTEWTQPTLFMVEYAMAMTWLELGLKPKFVLGHSVGEYPAAVISGAMSLETGIKLITLRGRLMQSVKKAGGMAAVMADLSTTKKMLSDFALPLDIAGINSKLQTVVSGDIEAIKSFITEIKVHKIRARELVVSHAFHSNHMDTILAEFSSAANQHKFLEQSRCKIISNLTGKVLETKLDGNYWAEHIRKPVNFLGGITEAINKGISNFIEVGPHPVLSALGSKSTEKECLWLSSANAKNEIETFYMTMGKLYNSSLIEAQ